MIQNRPRFCLYLCRKLPVNTVVPFLLQTSIISRHYYITISAPSIVYACAERHYRNIILMWVREERERVHHALRMVVYSMRNVNCMQKGCLTSNHQYCSLYRGIHAWFIRVNKEHCSRIFPLNFNEI